MCLSSVCVLATLVAQSAVASRGLALVFGQTVNSISTRGADYAHHSNTSPSGFSDLATALTLQYSHAREDTKQLDFKYDY